MIDCRSSKSDIHHIWMGQFLWFSFSDIGKYFGIQIIDRIQISQICKMSGYLNHLRKYDINQFRVLIVCLIVSHLQMFLPLLPILSQSSSNSLIMIICLLHRYMYVIILLVLYAVCEKPSLLLRSFVVIHCCRSVSCSTCGMITVFSWLLNIKANSHKMNTVTTGCLWL